MLDVARQVANSLVEGEGPLFQEGQPVRLTNSSPVNAGAVGKIVKVIVDPEEGPVYVVAVKDRGSIHVREKYISSEHGELLADR
jgi:hypothetical protein